jgi:hypothetical protein
MGQPPAQAAPPPAWLLAGALRLQLLRLRLRRR